MTTVEVKNLVKNYGKTKAVKGISFNIDKGEIFGLIGPNGAGKTTALRVISTLLQINSGEVRIMEYDVEKKSEELANKNSSTPQPEVKKDSSSQAANSNAKQGPSNSKNNSKKHQNRPKAASKFNKKNSNQNQNHNHSQNSKKSKKGFRKKFKSKSKNFKNQPNNKNSSSKPDSFKNVKPHSN